MTTEELERIRTSDDPQTAAWNVGYDHGYKSKPNTNPFIEGGELHQHYEEGYRKAQIDRVYIDLGESVAGKDWI